MVNRTPGCVALIAAAEFSTRSRRERTVTVEIREAGVPIESGAARVESDRAWAPSHASSAQRTTTAADTRLIHRIDTFMS
jgi:hypothetical protein